MTIEQRPKALRKSPPAPLRLALLLTALAVGPLTAGVFAGCTPTGSAGTTAKPADSGKKATEPAKPTTSKAPDFGIDKNSGKLEVGFVSVGTASDWGFNYQHAQARLFLQAELGDKVHTVFVENIPENADVERVMQRMADAGAGLIFSTSYGYADFVNKAAKKNPNVIFMQCLAPTKEAPNVATYTGNMWEAAYVSGVVAAMTAKDTTKYGFVGAHPIPPINFAVNAFILGAQTVNPKVTVDIVYTNNWNDPSAETEAVNSLATQKAGVIYAVVDSALAATKACERAGLYCVSNHADLSRFAPKGFVTGPIDAWGPLYVDIAKQVMAKTWKPTGVDGGYDKDYVAIAPFGKAVTGDAQEKAYGIIEKLKKGELNVFTGPITDNTGKLQVKEGESLTVAQINSMGWLAKGVHAAK